MSFLVRGAILSTVLLAPHGCRCNRTNNPNVTPIAESSVSANSAIGLREPLDIDASSQPTSQSASQAIPNAPGGPNRETIAVAQAGLVFLQIFKRGVDNYEIVRNGGIEPSDALYLKHCLTVPVLDGDKAVGFQLFGVTTGSVLDRLGLVNGDLIHHVNGQKLAGSEEATALYRDLQSARHVRVELIRDGRDRTINYEVR